MGRRKSNMAKATAAHLIVVDNVTKRSAAHISSRERHNTTEMKNEKDLQTKTEYSDGKVDRPGSR